MRELARMRNGVWARALASAAIGALVWSGIAPEAAAADDRAASPRTRLTQLSGADANSVAVAVYGKDRTPRAAFVRGEAIAIGVRSELSGQVLALLVDSHDTVTLVGGGDPGWRGEVAAGGETIVDAIGPANWDGGLPLGEADLFVFVLPPDAIAPLREAAQVEAGGIVPEAALPKLLSALEQRVERSGDAARPERVHLRLLQAGRTRGLGDGPDVSAAPLVTSEQIVAYFTGPRARAVSRVRLDLYIPFGYDRSDLSPAARKQVDEIAKAMRDGRMEDRSFVLGGHTDVHGSWEYNKQLSERRAAAVREVLLSEGVDAGQLKMAGYSYDRLLDTTRTPTADAANRRVELELQRN